MAAVEKCDGKNWKRSDLEEIIWNEILKLTVSIEDERLDIIEMTSQESAEQIRKKIDQIDTQISRLMDLYSIGSIPVEMIGSKIHDLTEEKTDLLNDLENADDPVLDPEEIICELRSAKDVKEKGTQEEQRALIEYLIQKIIILDDQITIHWRFL